MRIVTVAEIVGYVKSILDDDPILGDLWVRGEVSNFSRAGSGHIYFSLRSDQASLKCVLFRGEQALIPMIPGNGEAVLVHGRASLWPAAGQFQFYVDMIQPEGTGLLQIQFEELRARLEREGLFDVARKRPLPRLPVTVGVVTSSSGAVWHDIQNVLSRRYPLCELILSPTRVQGDEASGEIVSAIDRLVRDGRSEVIILARGGGSMEDLWCFNDERVARAIFGCRLPVISAIGHETDTTIADLVADLRAPTPSAAAELVAPHVNELRDEIYDLYLRASDASNGALQLSAAGLRGLEQRLQRRSPGSLVRDARLTLDSLAEGARRLIQAQLDGRRYQTSEAMRQLDLLHPEKVLGRGYAIVSDEASGARIGTTSRLQAGQRIKLTFHDGEATGNVDHVLPKPREDHHVVTSR